MSLLSKQAGFGNGSFYVLQSPNSRGRLYHIGELYLDEEGVENRVGFFKTFDKSREQSLGPSQFILGSNDLAAYLNARASDSELRLNPNFEGEEQYRKVFDKIKNRMSSGELKKAVLFSSSIDSDASFPSEADFFAYSLRLLKNQSAGYLFGFYNPKLKHAYLGLSPEFLCREDEGERFTTAVAGTKSGDDPGVDWSTKLIEEHELVKSGIAEKYSAVWSETSVQTYGELRHLKAEGCLKTNDSIEEVSEVLHPTAAVGVLPQNKSFEFGLGDLSHTDRGHFGGYACLQQTKAPFSLVTIRGVEWSNSKSFVCIGGGVLPESLLEDEWSELKMKWETFKSLWKT